MRLRSDVHAGRTAGFSLVELLIVAAILTVALGAVAMMWTSSQRAYAVGTTAAHLEERTAIALEKVVAELRIAGFETIAPDPGSGSPVIRYRQAVGMTAGDVDWTPLRQLAFEYEAGEVDDGLDNNGNGLIDEGLVVLTTDVGGPDERRRVLTRWVPELLEGELANGLDDNGNGLVDEPGFSVERVGETFVIRLSLQQRDARGGLLTRTGRTSTRMRN